MTIFSSIASSICDHFITFFEIQAVDRMIKVFHWSEAFISFNGATLASSMSKRNLSKTQVIDTKFMIHS